ncbi:IS110 family transposase [Kitasatospora sp. NA04385]|uniref:IS110 family transposase n=1 Tax=Kitasatospora sp. NA04385 TaxID=2742135 RepID=UPI001591140A|nr:IS110 family transposase [Kitasatospora sp. NA04385]QKW20549.1 IS110 family transposase [Kitasatospora sp. NA04385]
MPRCADRAISGGSFFYHLEGVFERMLYVGIDWSSGWLDLAVLDGAGVLLLERRIVYADEADPVAAYLDLLRSLARTWRSASVTGIEEVGLPFARALLAAGLRVVHVDPTLAARHRAALGIAKSDRADARLLADLVRQGIYRRVLESSPQAQALRVVAHAHRAAVEDRMEAVHALRAALERAWPAAITAWPASRGGLSSPQALAVLRAAPGPRAADLLTRARLADLLREAGRTRRLEDEAERLHLAFSRPAMLLHPQLEEAEAIRIADLAETLSSAVARVRRLEVHLACHYRRHRHHHVTTGIPGIGDILGAQLLAEIGDRPGERFGDARALAAYAGVSPVTWSSGTIVRVSLRRASSRLLRSTLHRAAFSWSRHSPGAAAYYRARREAGDPHTTALRKLGRKLIMCLYHCVTTGVGYDDALAFGYTPGPGAPTLARQPLLGEQDVARARDLLALPNASVSAVASTLGVSRQSIGRHVLGRPRSR